MPIVTAPTPADRRVDSTNVGKLVRPLLITRLYSAREGMRRWGLAPFGTNKILGASLTASGIYYSARSMQVKQV